MSLAPWQILRWFALMLTLVVGPAAAAPELDPLAPVAAPDDTLLKKKEE